MSAPQTNTRRSQFATNTRWCSSNNNNKMHNDAMAGALPPKKHLLFVGLLCFRPLLPRLECQNCQNKSELSSILLPSEDRPCQERHSDTHKKKVTRCKVKRGNTSIYNPCTSLLRRLLCIVMNWNNYKIKINK